MITRLNMHYYEIALISAISARDIKEAKFIIDRIKEFSDSNPPSLTVIDDKGANFISFAMQPGLIEVVHVLLDSQAFDDNKDILFSKNQQDQTLLCQAAELGFHTIAEKILAKTANLLAQIPADQQVHSPGYKIWLKADAKINTPLHYAAGFQCHELVTKLLELISTEDDHASLVNLANHVGDTPLHLVLRGDMAHHYVDALLTLGADPDRLNHQRRSPFGILFQRDEGSQISLIQQLSPENKKILLASYKGYLAAHPIDSRARKILYQATGACQGLSDLIVAHLETDPLAKMRNFYWSVTREDGFILKLNYKNIPPDEWIKRDIKSRQDVIYLYLENERVKFATRDDSNNLRRIDINDKLREFYQPIKEILQDKTQQRILNSTEQTFLVNIMLHYGYVLLFPPYKTRSIKKMLSPMALTDAELTEQLLKQDQDTLSKLISDIEIYLQDWGARKPVEVYKIISILISILIAISYLSFELIMIFSAAGSITYPASEALTSMERYGIFFIISCIFGVFGAIGAVFGAMCFFQYFWDKKPILTISQNEWQTCSQTLQQDIIEQLILFRDDDLPTDGRHILDLSTETDKLDGSKSREETIAIFTNISNILKKIRIDLDKKHRPFSFSLFAPKSDLRAVIVEQEPMIDTDEDEVIPLLSLTH